MSDWMCKNCGKPMKFTQSIGWNHYDSECEKPELDDDDSDIVQGTEFEQVKP